MNNMESADQRFKSDSLRQWVNLLAIIAAFVINVYANISPPNGLSIGAISNRFFNEVLIIPANYAFAIWGVIYLGLISFGIYQALPAQRQNPQLRRGGYWIAVASLAQIVWVFVFLYRKFNLSLVAMLGILLPLIVLYLRLGIGTERVSKKHKWLVHIPLSIYLGWISVATIVNVAIALYSSGWNGWGLSPQLWTVILLIIGAVLGAIVLLRRPADIAYPLVVVWAFIAIAVRQASQQLIAIPALGLAIALGGLVLFNVLRHPSHRATESAE